MQTSGIKTVFDGDYTFRCGCVYSYEADRFIEYCKRHSMGGVK